MIKELHRNGFEKLKERTFVSPATDMRFFLKPPTKFEGVATIIAKKSFLKLWTLRPGAPGSWNS
eukprot:snap_masked-scaffold_29-processed-gene-2.64-mRNA-1 protein AED:1.00 eAED:1.00 QI:0/-1/0/0/-1/1/1/0/63